jgi:hypothetical protein
MILKTAPTLDNKLLPEAAEMKLDVLSAMHFIAEPCRLITVTKIKNCYVKCHISIYHASRKDYRIVELMEGEEDDGHSLVS